MSIVSSPQRGSELKGLLRRDHTLRGGVLIGIDGYIVEIQARAVQVLRNRMAWASATSITGMPRGAMREALSRIVGAFAKFDVPEPQVEILINLAPADLPKEGTWLDLPLAIIMLQAAGMLPDLPEEREGEYVLMGELGIHGEIRRVPGALSLAYVAETGQKLIVPSHNKLECALILAKPGHEGCAVFPAETLDEVVRYFQGKSKLSNALKEKVRFEDVIPRAIDLGRVKGQEKAKKAAMISAAGGHNLLLIGPPGEGKSLLASAIPGLLPNLSNAEKVELTRIYSACGELERDGVAVTRRPFRSIHHTASKQSLIGGGSGVARPGEITLSHLGVLFVDEIAEFSRPTLEALRQPMESGEICISRVRATIRYPCRFTLVAAMNPCPCGFYGSDQCRCKDREVKQYQQKLSGPILDRIDLQVELERLSIEERFADTESDVSPRVRQVVQRARDRQVYRNGKEIPFNAAIPGGHVREYCQFSPSGWGHYKRSIEKNNISTRSMDRLGKVARTVADLRDSDHIEPEDVDEAATYVIGGILRDAF
ncbi:MAG: YifB family Mg chelatase-like AAA ATPase [Planctomycetaceae bacterium]